MTILIKNISLLYGKDLMFIDHGFININNQGIILDVGSIDKYSCIAENKATQVFDGEGLFVIPGLINAHTHIADSIGKDISIDFKFEEQIHPVYGIKRKILTYSDQAHIKYFIRNSAISMIKKVIITFVDFREGGVHGVQLLLDSLTGLPIKSVILGRIEYYFDLKEIQMFGRQKDNKFYNPSIPSRILSSINDLLKLSDGLGLSGANENTDSALIQYRSTIEKFQEQYLRKRKIIAIHAAESKKTLDFSNKYTKKTEVERIITFLKPNILVHMTHASLNDLMLKSKNKIGIVLCLRSNGILGNGIPDVMSMLKLGCKIAIGTDNIMVNSPDLLRELDYLWKVFKSSSPRYSTTVKLKELLKMITVNPGELFRLNSGSIDKGKFADLLFIDKFHLALQPIHNVYSSIIHRLSYDAIKSVMINGRFVHDITF